MSKKRVVITNVPFYGNGFRGLRAGCRWPFIVQAELPPENTPGAYQTFPAFMSYATQFLKNKLQGWDVVYYDALALNHKYQTFYAQMQEIKPDVVIMETSTPSITNDLEVAKNLKDMGSEIALCGTHATVYADELVKLPYVDYVLQGEYEVNSFEMLIMRRKGVYKCRPMFNLNGVFPHRDWTTRFYADGFGQDASISYPQLTVVSSRGCPYHCKFCLWNETMTCRKYRTIDSETVMKDIFFCLRQEHFNSILFDDDTFNVGDKRTEEMSQMMEQTGMQWHAMVRADSCSWKSFWKMKEAGCVGLKIGVETFNQAGLDYLNKGYNAQYVKETLDFLIISGFKVFISLMTDIPGETEDDKKHTLDMLAYYKSMGVSFQNPMCMPLPGTTYFNELENQGKIDKSDWTQFGKFHGEVIKC